MCIKFVPRNEILTWNHRQKKKTISFWSFLFFFAVLRYFWHCLKIRVQYIFYFSFVYLTTLFNYTGYRSIVSNNWTIINDECGIMWKKAAMDHFKLISPQFVGQTEQKHEKSQTRESLFRLRFKRGSSQTRNWNFDN